MEKTGSIETFNGLLLDERAAWLEVKHAPPSLTLTERRRLILSHLQRIGQDNDIGLILATEKALLVNDATLYANSPAMKTSLKTALKELEAAEKSLPLVQDPTLYQAVDTAHGHPKSRTGGLPNDAVRRFCSSQAARLLNMDKSRLDADEKKVVEARKRNMRSAEKSYALLQRRTLGLGQEQSMGLSR